MLMETLVLAGAFAGTFATAWRADDINEEALSTLKQAHDIHADAVALFERHKQDADASLQKLVNRKKGILSTRMNQFISVYEKIRAIDFRPEDGILELYANQLSVRQVDKIKIMVTTSMKPMSEKELAVKYLFTGVGGMLLADSKRNVAIANTQKQIANTLYAQSKTLVIAMDTIGKHAEQVASLLSHFSVLFGESINATKQIIQRNGTSRERYSRSDREVLMNCLNLAVAIKAILDVPILNADGSITEASLKALQDGECRIHELKYSL